MKRGNIILSGILSGVILILACYEYGWAQAKESIGPAKIAVVNIRNVFQNCKRNQQYKDQMTAAQEKVVAELDKLSKEIEAVKADINTRKIGSADYLELTKSLMEKKSILDARQEYFQKELMMKEQQWTEKLYQEILDKISQIAKQKGVDMVLDKGQLELPAASPTDLMLSIRTNKVLYCADYLDITAEVLAALDEKN